jgi:hypothetical protein
MSRTLTTRVPKLRNVKRRCDVHIDSISEYRILGFPGRWKCQGPSQQESRTRDMRNREITLAVKSRFDLDR